MAPAIPFAASITTRRGRSAETSTKLSTRSTKRDQMSSARISPRVGRAPVALHGAVAHIEKARLAADRQRPGAHDLHARVLLRVVRRRDGDTAVEPELADREIDHLCADEPEVEHLRAAVRGALAHGRGHRRRRHAHVVPDGDPLGLELVDERAADAIRTVLVELRLVEAADVVRLERQSGRARAQPYKAGLRRRGSRGSRPSTRAWRLGDDRRRTVECASASRSGSARSVPSP